VPKRNFQHLLRVAAVLLALNANATAAAATPRVDPSLARQVAAAPLTPTAAVITYYQRPLKADFDRLRAIGIRGGIVLRELPMVLTAVTSAQLDILRGRPEIRSLYANHRFPLMMHEARPFIGLDALRADAEVTRQLGGIPVSGKGIGVAYVDTGIDATHPDLQLGSTVVQNVLFPLAEYSATEVPIPSDFVPIVAIEDQPFTDAEGGHGTFGAAVTAGTGTASGGLFAGVAPGAQLVGLVAGNDVGLTTFAIVQAYDYALANQFRYNIRVCNNSFGTNLAVYAYDPHDPINTATREMHDRNIVVVFAAGNGIDNIGDVAGAINPFSVAPWVISVAAGEKHSFGTPARFSSRGEDNGTGTDIAGQPADPAAPPNLRPDIMGSGIDITSARSKGAGVTNTAGALPIFVGGNDLFTIPPAFLPFYATANGTSFATPQVSGVVALMLEATPTLTPDEVVMLLRQTATPMPFDERVVGAGYVDAHNAVRAAMALGAVNHPRNLFPAGIELVDEGDDQLAGTKAQDIRTGDFGYDADANQLVYTLTMADLAQAGPNTRWTMSSRFEAVTVFVAGGRSETGSVSFVYGRIAADPNSGVATQATIGQPDSGSFIGDQMIVRLSLDKVNAAVGFDTLYTTSTALAAQAQVVIGASVSPRSLLLNSDSASGGDATFRVGEPPTPGVNVQPTETLFTSEEGGVASFSVALASAPAAGREVVIDLSSSNPQEGTVTPPFLTFTRANWNVAQAVNVTGVEDQVVDGDVHYEVVLAPAVSTDPQYSGFDPPDVSLVNADNDSAPPPPPACDRNQYTERFAGVFEPGQPFVEIAFTVTCGRLDARLHASPSGSLSLVLLGPDGQQITDEHRHADRVTAERLVPGSYRYRIIGSVTDPMDFVLQSRQKR
jgi:subtilisin family serine protease